MPAISVQFLIDLGFYLDALMALVLTNNEWIITVKQMESKLCKSGEGITEAFNYRHLCKCIHLCSSSECSTNNVWLPYKPTMMLVE